MKNRVKLYLGALILLLCFFFIGKAFFINLRGVDFHNIKFNLLFLLLSYAVWTIAFLLEALIWKYSMVYLGEKLSFIKALRVISLSILPKYLPGKLWGMASMVWLTKEEEGVSGGKGSVGIILNTGVNILSGMLLACIILPFVLKSNPLINIRLLFVFIPLFFIALHPIVFIKISNFFLRKLKRAEIKIMPNYSKSLILLGLYIVFWFCQSVAIFFLIRSFYPILPSFIIPLCGIFPTATVIGILSFFTAGGLGIREGILSYLFSIYLPTSIGIIAAVVIRIWGTIGELIFFAFFARNLKKYI